MNKSLVEELVDADPAQVQKLLDLIETMLLAATTNLDNFELESTNANNDYDTAVVTYDAAVLTHTQNQETLEIKKSNWLSAKEAKDVANGAKIEAQRSLDESKPGLESEIETLEKMISLNGQLSSPNQAMTDMLQEMLSSTQTILGNLESDCTNTINDYNDAVVAYDAAVIAYDAAKELVRVSLEALDIAQEARDVAQGAKTLAQYNLDSGKPGLEVEISTLGEMLTLNGRLNPEYHLFFKQTFPTLKDKAGWLSTGGILEPNFSRLNLLDDSWKGVDGKFQFKLVWPGSDVGFNEWKQSSNPVTKQSSGVDGYEAININSDCHSWSGLEYNTRPSSLLDGSVDHSYWFYAIGSSVAWGGGVPGGCFGGAGVAQQVVELYVVKPRDESFDFESGSLDGWTLTGTAFNNQPTYGDNPTARNRGQTSNHEGNWWIGTYENCGTVSGCPSGAGQGDGVTGTATSPVFTLTGTGASFLIGGGNYENEQVELIVGGVSVLKSHGNNNEHMERKTWDISSWTGQSAQLKLVDAGSGGWGHINFDDWIQFD